jgi:LmbE family N-acetylglucosaminyl deacetylase
MIDESQLVPYQSSPLPIATGPWLVFAPHADDESFGMGGTLALACAAGLTVHVVIMTDGALGGEMDDLVNVREQEARAAATLAGISSVLFLKQQDRGLQPESQLVRQVAQLIEASTPAAVFFPGIYEAHPDHRATALLVWQALQMINSPGITPVAYEITGQSPINCLVDITGVIEKKKKMVGIYQSQLGQRNYLDIVLALNRLRTFTLGAEVQWAEGFYVYAQADLSDTLAAWGQERLRKLLIQ